MGGMKTGALPFFPQGKAARGLLMIKELSTDLFPSLAPFSVV